MKKLKNLLFTISEKKYAKATLKFFLFPLVGGVVIIVVVLPTKVSSIQLFCLFTAWGSLLVLISLANIVNILHFLLRHGKENLAQ